MMATYGFLSHPDYESTPECIILWGFNPSATGLPESRRITESLKKGARLIVIDPCETDYAKKADLWVKPRPGSDLALAMGIINTVINENLFDSGFVEQWTVGFDKLRAHVQTYTPEKASEITWVPENAIKEIARSYAAGHQPGSLVETAWKITELLSIQPGSLHFAIHYRQHRYTRW